MRELTAIPTLGPKKATTLHERLGVSSVDELAAAIDDERLRELKGFGPKTEENLRHGIALLRQAGGRVHLDVATDLAEEVVEQLRQVTGCADCTYAGSLRRVRETVGDIDILAAAEESAPLMKAFAGPDRLDLSDQNILLARRHGVKFAVNTDAHAAAHLGNLRYGVGTAQRGWLTADDVINTWPLRCLRAFLRT